MTNDPIKKLSLTNPIHFLALGFGSGLAPKAPGTFGTLAAIPLVLLASQPGFSVYCVLTFMACVCGIWICDKSAKDMGVHDHGAIVWDEVAGLMVTMLFVPITWLNILVGFLSFRLFDIVKPWPISWLDSKVHGGLGIMLDDIVAGVFAGLALLALVEFSIL